MRSRAPSSPVPEVELQDISFAASSHAGVAAATPPHLVLPASNRGAAHARPAATSLRVAPDSGEGDASGGCSPAKLLPGPPWVRNIILCELCERFGYYGLRAVLVLYFNEGLGYSEPTSISLFAFASALAYLMSLFGGILSDSYLGKYKTIFYCTMVYCAGSAMLALTSFPRWAWGAFVALVLISIGTGGIKPCVSTFGAEQFSGPGTVVLSEKARGLQLQSYFMVFYFAINVGALGSQILTPLLRDNLGFPAAFGLPSCLLATSGLILWFGRNRYHIVPPQGSVFSKVYKVVKMARLARKQHKTGAGSGPVTVLDRDVGPGGKVVPGRAPMPPVPGTPTLEHGSESPAVPVDTPARLVTTPVPLSTVAVRGARLESAGGRPKAGSVRLLDQHTAGPRTFLDYAREYCDDNDVDNVKALAAIMPIFCVLPAFWMCFDQQGSSWTLQAKHMNTYGLQPEQIQSLGTWLVIVLVPVFDKLVYPRLRKAGIDPHPLRRMPLGMLIASSSFFCSFFVQLIVDSSEPGTVSVLLQVPGYILITVGEILVSITGLEFAYSEAPESMKSVIMALFYMTVAVGDIMTGLIFNIFSAFLPTRWIFFVFASLMVVAFGAFVAVAKRYRRPVPMGRGASRSGSMSGDSASTSGPDAGPASDLRTPTKRTKRTRGARRGQASEYQQLD